MVNKYIERDLSLVGLRVISLSLVCCFYLKSCCSVWVRHIGVLHNAIQVQYWHDGIRVCCFTLGLLLSLLIALQRMDKTFERHKQTIFLKIIKKEQSEDDN